MKLFTVILTPNVINGEKTWLTVTKEQLKYLESYKNIGGFLRFSIDLYQETTSKRTKRNKWFKFNNGQTERQIDYFFHQNHILKPTIQTHNLNLNN